MAAGFYSTFANILFLWKNKKNEYIITKMLGVKMFPLHA